MNLPRYLTIGFVIFATTWQVAAQTNPPAAKPASVFRIALSSGTTNVFVQRAGASVWDPAYDGQLLAKGDRIQTRDNVRLTLICPDGTTLRIGEFADLEIQPEPDSPTGLAFFVRRARLYFFHRGGPTDLKLRTRTASAAVRGTEFEFDAEEDGNAQIVVLDGEVALQNELGEVVARNGEQATAIAGQPPAKTAVIEAVNIIQWSLYYPAILDLEDLRFEPEALDALKQSLTNYREGNLLGALAAYPSARSSVATSETIFHSALLLSVGKVKESEALLATLDNSPAPQTDIDRNRRLADALRKLVASVKMQDWRDTTPPQSASEWLAESYLRQSRADLKSALEAARQATLRSPHFGFAWARVAELEFGFARTAAASDALQKALEFSPHNAQALALRGFTLAARNEWVSAIEAFDQALAMDSALGNAWLGRGLCRIRRGDLEGGVEDLQTAVVVEPQRAILRSYLGKGFAVVHRNALAGHELDLAKELDRDDPTAWLYSALLDQENNRLNEAVRDLEKSKDLNDNRSLYRSQLLLDQDRAVRGTSLASIYRDDGMTEVSVREAAQAVTSDYANYSAHLFLANSYDALRDPTRFNLRYETAWFNELLLANLLAPVGAGTFAQSISQQEYSQLFETKQFGLTTTTDARSDGQYREVTSQFGSFGNFGYSLDLDYQHNDDVGAHGRPNNELDRIEWYSQLKFQLTPADTLFLLTKYQDYHSGDNFQYFDWRTSAVTNVASVRTNFTFDEYQSPIVVAGYHHEWQPGVHTLLLAGRLENDQRFSDQAVPLPVFIVFTNGQLSSVRSTESDVQYRSQLETWIGEASQIFQGHRNTVILGGRFQAGEFETRNTLTNVTPVSAFFPAISQTVHEDFQRWSLYVYDTWEAVPNLWLTAGVSYDNIKYPENHRQVPISAGEGQADCLGPKAALVWSPSPLMTVRAAYSRSLGGVSLDESYRLEPSQLAGFIQTFRTIIPESVVGSVSAPTFETIGSALDLRFKTRTYIGLVGEILNSDVDRFVGVYRGTNVGFVGHPSSTPQRLNYKEYSASLGVNQLLSDEWALGASYRFTRSELDQMLPEVPASRFDRADLQRVSLYLLYQHPSGFFALAESNWYWQQNSMSTNASSGQAVLSRLPGDNFSQLNFWLGYRFPRRRGDIALGLLNATGTDYTLNPLSPYSELPRERVVAARLRFRF